MKKVYLQALLDSFRYPITSVKAICRGVRLARIDYKENGPITDERWEKAKNECREAFERYDRFKNH